MSNLIAQLPNIKGAYIANKPLAELTTIKVGGPAEVWADFDDLDDVVDFLKNKPEDVPFTVLGEGSNVLIRDGGLRGVVTRLQPLLSEVVVMGDTIYAGSGATCGKVARAAREAGLTGLEFYAGIPGSVGGALFMNAGCYGVETADRLVSVEIMDAKGEMDTLTPQDLNYRYRGCDLPKGVFFIGATFKLQAGDKEEIRQQMRKINAERRESQPLNMPSSGSWFKNIEVDGVKTNAWKIVDQAGCRGMQIGGAQVSEKHANFFVNAGGATAKDLEALSQKVEAQIKEKLGVVMVREVRFIGEES